MPDMGDLDFSKLGAGAGGDQPGLAGSDDDDSDEDMPDLASDDAPAEVTEKEKEPASTST
jgi:hypothetical protein